jgi:phage regulator Rha-like protein
MNNPTINISHIQNRIYTIRGIQVMLDEDLAEIYQVQTKVFNQAVKRNSNRFPENFRFQLTDEEWEYLRSQIVTLNSSNPLRSQNVTIESQRGKHRKYLPYAFTEQGVAMLSAVLRSDTAVNISIQIMQAFVEMKKFITSNALLFQRLENVELKQMETDRKVLQLFSAIQEKSVKPKQGIFFEGQVFDAYSFAADLIRTAKKSIVLIDNYIDDTVLTLFTKRKQGVSLTIFTKQISKQMALDLKKHNQQYEPIEMKEFADAHDRFLIIDEKTVYHFGASLKDLGKKWFAFSKFDKEAVNLLNKLNR